MRVAGTPVALGVRMHSGWGVLVGVSEGSDGVEVMERRRMVIAEGRVPGACQPFHFAAKLRGKARERHLAESAAAAEREALREMQAGVAGLSARGCDVVGCAVLLAAGRELPELEKILASHALIHTAEGEFFRDAVRWACGQLGVPVMAVRERDVGVRVREVFGSAAEGLEARIGGMGKVIGPPWTRDHKLAALAALVLLRVGETDG